MVTSSSASSSLKEYLKRYESNIEEEKKKKKKKKKPRADVTGVVVVDEDPVWQKQVNLEEEENDSADEEKPQIDEDIEVKRMKRLEQLRARRPFGVISEDGSGWVPVSDAPTSSNTRDQLSDISPPRRMTRNDTPSPGPESRPSSTAIADLSPPRKRRARNDKLSPEPEREPSSKADADLSPQRKRRARNDSPSRLHELKPSSTTVGDLSPRRQRRERYESPSPEPETKFSRSLGTGSKQLKLNDISPPRRRRAHYDTPSPRSDLETSKSSREVVDLSPPRRQRQRQHSPSPEPGRKASRPMAVGSDLSPPRRSYLQKSSDNIWKNSDMADMPDNSAPSRIRRSSPYQDDSGSSPAGDLSPPRKSRKDRSPPQSRHPVSKNDTAVSDLSRSRRRQKESPVPIQQPKTGLVTGRDVKEEVTKTKNEEWLRFKEMDVSVSGRGAEPVFRDKITGKRMSKEEFLKSQKKEKDEKPKEIKLEWGKGLAQKREAEARLKELELEKEKPFARSRDDPELDRMLKDRVRWGDPMAHLVKKKPLEPVLPDFGDNEKVKESGFIIPQEIPSHSWIKRGLDAPPNRFGIKPGRHWDGVDRSNGTEKQFFKRMNEKQATEREAYLWSVADM